MTPLEQAESFGRRTAVARHDHDEARAQGEREAFRRWLRVQVHGYDRTAEQQGALRSALETAFADGYRTEYRALDGPRH